MSASLRSEDVSEQVGAAVQHLRLLGEVIGAIDETDELHDLLHLK